MSLRRLQVTDFRCVRSASFELDPHFTLISGPNASGKTSLLEAMYLLGRGRSFRTRHLEHLIRRESDRFIVFGEVVDKGRPVGLGVEGSARGIRARLGGQNAGSLSELAGIFPVLIIDPEVHRLIEEGPSRRRRFLDWGTFHVEPNFVVHWQRYQQALKQRNAALKSGRHQSTVLAWDPDLLKYGDLITSAREKYLELLSVHAEEIAKSLLGMDLGLTYRAGWARERTFREALEQSRAHDRDSGATQVGPHRADVAIRLDGMFAKDRISRGQQKLLAAALLVAQMKLFPDGESVRPTLLLDDPSAELDNDRLSKLIVEVSAHAAQLVVTTLHSEFAAFGEPGRRFRMHNGSVELV